MKTSIAEMAAANYFVSGLNAKTEPLAVARAGYNIGISCDRASSTLLAACEEIAALTDVKIFVDSGAFAEVEFVPGQGLVTKKPLDDAEWKKRFEIYRRLAKSCGYRCYLVAPDKVGDQCETLERMKRYSATMHELRDVHGFADAGPQIIVPIQNGDMTPADFATAACEALGFSEDEIIYGIPLKKGATTIEQLAEFAATCPPDQRFHLLGMGPKSRLFERAMLAILESCPDADVTCDAVRITALVGRKPLRPLTAAQDAYRAEHPDASGCEVKLHATKQVLGVESVELLTENGWRDPELHVDGCPNADSGEHALDCRFCSTDPEARKTDRDSIETENRGVVPHNERKNENGSQSASAGIPTNGTEVGRHADRCRTEDRGSDVRQAADRRGGRLGVRSPRLRERHRKQLGDGNRAPRGRRGSLFGLWRRARRRARVRLAQR